MRIFATYVLGPLALGAVALVAAPSASASAVAAGKNHGSSDLPWVIGLVVIVAVVLGVGLLRLRSGMAKRDDTAHGTFRQP